MKILISCKNNQDHDVIDERFGRCEYYLIYNTQTNQQEKIENTASAGAHGAGPKAAQIAINNRVNSIITGNLGLKALSVIQETDITAYYNQGPSIQDNIQLFLKDGLKAIKSPGPSNQGK